MGRTARAWYAATAVLVAVGVTAQLIASARNNYPFPSATVRVLNVPAYFTQLSNVIVGITSGILAWRPGRTRSTVFRIWRLTGLVAIAITGLIYNTLLAGLVPLNTFGHVANIIEHMIVPVIAVVAWLVFGPRGQTSWPIAAAALIFPIAWVTFTLIRGAVIDWYPYPFLDPTKHGYGRVAINTLAIACLFIALSAAATAADRALTARTKAPQRQSDDL